MQQDPGPTLPDTKHKHTYFTTAENVQITLNMNNHDYT